MRHAGEDERIPLGKPSRGPEDAVRERPERVEEIGPVTARQRVRGNKCGSKQGQEDQEVGRVRGKAVEPERGGTWLGSGGIRRYNSFSNFAIAFLSSSRPRPRFPSRFIASAQK